MWTLFLTPNSYFFGSPPAHFSWRVSKTERIVATPMSFYREHVQPQWNVDDFCCVVHAPNKPLPALFTVACLGNCASDGVRVEYLNLPMEEVERLCEEQLAQGTAVWMGCDYGAAKDAAAAILDPLLYVADPHIAVPALSKAERLDLGASRMTHAMVLVGCDRGGPDAPLRWRVENSHGSKKGFGGFCHASGEWFREFVYEVAIRKSLLSAAALEVLHAKRETITLPPWDPLGALARE